MPIRLGGATKLDEESKQEVMEIHKGVDHYS